MCHVCPSLSVLLPRGSLYHGSRPTFHFAAFATNSATRYLPPDAEPRRRRSKCYWAILVNCTGLGATSSYSYMDGCLDTVVCVSPSICVHAPFIADIPGILYFFNSTRGVTRDTRNIFDNSTAAKIGVTKTQISTISDAKFRKHQHLYKSPSRRLFVLFKGQKGQKAEKVSRLFFAQSICF